MSTRHVNTLEVEHDHAVSSSCVQWSYRCLDAPGHLLMAMELMQVPLLCMNSLHCLSALTASTSSRLSTPPLMCAQSDLRTALHDDNARQMLWYSRQAY